MSGGGSTPTRIFIVDDHEMMRIGLRESLNYEDDLEVVGEWPRATGAAQAVLQANPDVAILDVILGDGNGIELCREIRAASDIRCLVFTSAVGEEPLYESLMAGASGFLLKDVGRGEIVSAIRKVAAGGSLVDPSSTSRLFARLRKAEAGVGADLTEQEAKILDLIAEGLTNREISDRMYLAEQTVKNYVSRVLTKLDMRRTQAALFRAAQVKEEDQDL